MSLPAATEPELVLGRYLLGPRAGAGAYGSVYSATDTHSGQTVVVKFFDGQEDNFGAWTSEMRLVLRFRHEHIVPCLDIGFDQVHRLWALVYAKAQGGSLRRALANKRRFRPRQNAQLLMDIASALAYAHAHGVIHRDVKPENILAQQAENDTRWLLTDFGAGRYLASGEIARSPAGSVEYMAPEVLACEAGTASDQYSLGVLGCELWLGRLPRPDELITIHEVLRGQGPLPEILARLCARDPSARFASMDEVVRSLQQVLIDMKDNGDILVFVRNYLQVQRGLSESDVDTLLREWGERSSILDFLVDKKLLSRTSARTAEAIRKGYLDASLDSVFGPVTAKSGTATDSLPLPSGNMDLPSRLAGPARSDAATGVRAAGASRADGAIRREGDRTRDGQTAESGLAAAADNQTPDRRASAAASREVGSPSDSANRPEPAARTMPAVRLGPGVRLGRYVLQEALGEGATATVFRSFHELLSMPVAIKVFEPLDASGDPESASRFRREAQTLVRLEHPNIVRIVDVDVAEGLPFIVMEYVGETTLATQIQNLGRLPATRIAQIGLAVSDALDAATRQGLLHRDVKPSNILERKDGHIKLVDFGIAAHREHSGLLSDPQAALGLVSGTPAYIAPEQALRPNQIDFRADMYSLGATLYHAATGRPLFTHSTAQDLLMAHIQEMPVHINDLDSGFDPHLASAIHHMLAKQPEHRFPSWQAVREALSQSLQRADEPEVLITQTATGVDLPRSDDPRPEDSGGAPSASMAVPAERSAEEKGVSHNRAPHPAEPSPMVPQPPAAQLQSPHVHSSTPTVAAVHSLMRSPSAQSAMGRLRAAGSRLRTGWEASPLSERRLAVAAVSLLVLTVLFLFLFSGRS